MCAKLIGRVEIDMATIRLPVISQDGSKLVGEKIIQPWGGIKGVKGLGRVPLWMWCKNDTVLTADIQEVEHAILDRIEDTKAVMPDGEEIPYKQGVFFDYSDSKLYTIATDLIPANVKEKDHVKLTILGCCSIIGIQKLLFDQTDARWKTISETPRKRKARSKSK